LQVTDPVPGFLFCGLQKLDHLVPSPDHRAHLEDRYWLRRFALCKYAEIDKLCHLDDRLLALWPCCGWL
jgi:hypothetical protein